MNTQVEYAVHELKNRSNWTMMNQLMSLGNVALSKGAPMYASIWMMDDSVKELMRLRKTVKSYSGTFELPRIILDVDRANNTDQFVFNQVVSMIKDMQSAYPWFNDNHEVWYSGTGYHIVIPEVFGFEISKETPEIVKATMKSVFPWVDQACFTRSSMVRTPSSFNGKSDRYKIKIPTANLLAPGFEYELILETAEAKPQAFTWYREFPLQEKPLNDKIVKPSRVFQVDRPVQGEVRETSNIITCMQTVYNMGEQQGTRHQRLLRLASWMRRQALPISAAQVSLYAYAPSLPTVEIDKIVADVYERGYPYGCEDPIMAQFCDPKCIFAKNKNYTAGVLDSGSLERSFVTHVRSNRESRMINLREYWQMPVDYKIYPGELVTLIGDTKLGKSAWYQNLAVAMSPHRVIYLSLEVGQQLMYRRLLQIAHGMSKDDIVEHYRTHDNTLSAGISNIMMTTEAPKLSDIIKMITDYRPLAIMIDTLDMVDAGTNEPIQQVEICAKTLKAIAEKLQVIIFVVHHISKGNAIDQDGRPLPMTIHSGKYATTLQQKSDKVIALEGARGSNRRIVRSLGSRDEQDFKLVYDVDWNTFRFNQASENSAPQTFQTADTTPPSLPITDAEVIP